MQPEYDFSEEKPNQAHRGQIPENQRQRGLRAYRKEGKTPETWEE